MIRVAIADDHDLIRSGFAELVAHQDGIILVGEAETAADAYELLSAEACDILVLDISLPDARGLDVLGELRRRFPDVAILILSMHSEEQYGLRSLEQGAAGYVTKGMDSRVLISAIRRIASGGKYVSADLAERLADERAGRNRGAPHESLSDREFQVLLRIAQGVPTGRIAADLHLSPNTVQTYRRRILTKLDVSSNAELTRYVVSHHLADES